MIDQLETLNIDDTFDETIPGTAERETLGGASLQVKAEIHNIPTDCDAVSYATSLMKDHARVPHCEKMHGSEFFVAQAFVFYMKQINELNKLTEFSGVLFSRDGVLL